MNFLNKKFYFKKNNHKDVIFLDDNYANIKLNKISFCSLNFNEINIYYIIKALFQRIFLKEKKLKFKDLYYRNLLNSFTPGLVIGHDLNGKAFYCKKICPKILTLTYQLGIIWEHEIDEFRERFRGNRCDYYYVYDSMYKDIFSQFIKSKFVISGSVKNNEIKLTDDKKKYDITYVSEFRGTGNNETKSLEYQSYVIKLLDQYCENKNINFHVALNSNRAEKKSKINFHEEIKFIKKFSKNCILKNLSSYELATQSKITVCLNSNLGYELFARKKRVLFIKLNEFYGDKRKSLYISNNNLSFMALKNDKNLILEKLDKIMTMSEVEWMKIFNQSSLKIPYDEGNILLKNNIRKYISAVI